MNSFPAVAKRFAFLSACLLMFVSASARADWPSVSKEELAFKDVPGMPDAPAVILFHEEIDDDTLHFHQVYYRIKILNEAGRKYADVQIPYDRHGFDVTNVKGRTTQPDGTTKSFEGKALDKEVLKAQGYKVHVKTVTLPDVQVGSVIEYMYSWRYDDNIVVPPSWVLQEELYQRKEHFRFTPTTHDLIDESGKPTNGLAWVSSLPKGADIRSIRDQYYELNLTDVPAFLEEEHMPPSMPFKYRASFYYRWDTRKEDYWKNKGKGWVKSVEKFVNKDGGVRAKVNELITPADTQEQKARKIYAFVQTLDNTSYMPGKNLEELKAAGLKWNASAEDVLRQKRGNRDDITRLYISMCRAAGLTAWDMWVTDRDENLFSDAFLSTDQLDDEIAFVTIDGKEVAVDPGTKFAPFGTINWHYTFSSGLKQVDSGKAEIAKSPQPMNDIDAIQRQGSFMLDSEGSAKGTLLVRFYGQEALSRRLSAARTDAAGRTKMLEEEAKEWLPSNSDVSLVKEPNWNEYEKGLDVAFKISTSVVSRAGKRLMIEPDFLVAGRPERFAHAERRLPIYFHHPTREIDTISITLPGSLEVESLTPASQADTTWAAYRVERTQNAQTIMIKRDLQLAAVALQSSDYPLLRAFYQKVKEGDDQAVLIRSAAHAQNQ